MKDTKPRVATCNRCSNIVLAAYASGCRAAVDPTPLTFAQMRDVLLEGAQAYRVYMSAGRPQRLELVHRAMMKLPGAPYGVYGRAHGCGCHAMDATAFEESVDPSQAPVTPGRPADGLHHPSAPVEGSQGHQGPSRARSATRRLSDLPAIRCGRCGKVIPAGDENRFMIVWPEWYEDTFKTRPKPGVKSETYTLSGWGENRWAVHSDGCPAGTTGSR